MERASTCVVRIRHDLGTFMKPQPKLKPKWKKHHEPRTEKDHRHTKRLLRRGIRPVVMEDATEGMPCVPMLWRTIHAGPMGHPKTPLPTLLANHTNTMNLNPNCCGGQCSSASGPVRVLPIGKIPEHGNLILCRSCFEYEKAWRIQRNRELTKDCHYDLPEWHNLEVYES